MSGDVEKKAKLLTELKAFAPPNCPHCTSLGEPTLDEDGYFCARCLEPLANGWEFDQTLERYKRLAAQ